jgi:hypothetical protein
VVTVAPFPAKRISGALNQVTSFQQQKLMCPLSTSTPMLLDALSSATQRYSNAMPFYSSSARRISKLLLIVALIYVVLRAFYASGSVGDDNALSSTFSVGGRGSTLGGWPWRKPPMPRRTRVMVASSFGAHDDGESRFRSFSLQVLATMEAAP